MHPPTADQVCSVYVLQGHAYLMEADTRVDGPWDDTMELEAKPQTTQMPMFETFPLRHYQQELYNRAQQFETR